MRDQFSRNLSPDQSRQARCVSRWGRCNILLHHTCNILRQRWSCVFLIRDATLSSMGASRPIRNVLVVDDDQAILDCWRRSAGRDRTVWSTQESSAARKIATTQHFDLAIVDLRLGPHSGLELVRDLRRDFPEMPIVLCSGYLSVDVTVAAVRAGADIVVFKPITFKEVLRRLNENLDEPDLDDTPTLARAEWEHIMRVLADCNGNVSAAARRLGIFRSSLQRRLRKYTPQ
jgi:two-component system response regulator RegA